MSPLAQPRQALPVPPPQQADATLGPIIDQFRSCVCGELAAAKRPVCRTCGCCLYPGDTLPPATACDCKDGGQGQAWVRIVGWEPQQTTNRRETKHCQPVRLRITLEAGVYRCVTTVGPDGQSPPTCEEQDADFWGLLADAAALRRAVSCCPALQRRGLEVTKAEPTGVQGGCAGQLIQFALDV